MNGHPRILLATICLNEMEWLPKLIEQHRDWPGAVGWVFVEGTDAAYAKANPEMVNDRGLSVDGTTGYLRYFASLTSFLQHIPYGHVRGHSRDQGKAKLRDACIVAGRSLRPDYVIQLDADVFYTRDAQRHVCECLVNSDPESLGMCFRSREIWRPPSQSGQPLFALEATDGLWGTAHCHCWRYVPYMEYKRSHVWPQLCTLSFLGKTKEGMLMSEKMERWDQRLDSPEYVHLGWASYKATREAKTRYYEARGEKLDPSRNKWMECREAWSAWKPGDVLPHGARVVPYTGPIPECFAESK